MLHLPVCMLSNVKVTVSQLKRAKISAVRKANLAAITAQGHFRPALEQTYFQPLPFLFKSST